MSDVSARLRASRSTWENARGVPSDLEAEAADHGFRPDDLVKVKEASDARE